MSGFNATSFIHQKASDRAEWTNFMNEVKKLGYKVNEDYFSSQEGQAGARFKREVLENKKVAKLMDKYHIMKFANFEGKVANGATVLQEGNRVTIVSGEASTIGKKGTILEARLGLDGYTIQLDDKRIIKRGLHEIKESLDPVGKEDKDINNDGKENSSDDFLAKRREAINNKIAKEGVDKSELEYSTLDEAIEEALNGAQQDENAYSQFEEYSAWKSALGPNVSIQPADKGLCAYNKEGEEVGKWYDYTTKGVIYNNMLTEDNAEGEEDMDYWEGYSEEGAAETDNPKLVDKVIDAAVREWNQGDDGNPIINLDDKVVSLSHQFFTAKGYLNAGIVQAMISQLTKEPGLEEDFGVDLTDGSPNFGGIHSHAKLDAMDDHGMDLNFDALDDNQLVQFGEEQDIDTYGKTRSQIIDDINTWTMTTQQDIENFLHQSNGPSLEEEMVSTLSEGADFPFDKVIDFRHIGDNETFAPGTPEYSALDAMDEDEWQEYSDEMRNYEVTVDYDVDNDVFKVIPSINEPVVEQMDTMIEDTERYETIEEDVKTIKNLVEQKGCKLVECRGFKKSSGQKDKLEIIVEKFGKVKERIVYDDNKLQKPWSIGRYEFNFIQEAIDTIEFNDKQDFRADIKSQEHKVKRLTESYITDPQKLSADEKAERERRGQEIFDKLMNPSLLNRNINR